MAIAEILTMKYTNCYHIYIFTNPQYATSSFKSYNNGINVLVMLYQRTSNIYFKSYNNGSRPPAFILKHLMQVAKPRIPPIFAELKLSKGILILNCECKWDQRKPNIITVHGVFDRRD